MLTWWLLVHTHTCQLLTAVVLPENDSRQDGIPCPITRFRWCNHPRHPSHHQSSWVHPSSLHRFCFQPCPTIHGLRLHHGLKNPESRRSRLGSTCNRSPHAWHRVGSDRRAGFEGQAIRGRWRGCCTRVSEKRGSGLGQASAAVRVLSAFYYQWGGLSMYF